MRASHPNHAIHCVGRTLLVLAGLMLLGGCAKEHPPTDPRGGMQRFSDGVFFLDRDALWESIAEPTREILRAGYADLLEMDELVTYLQTSEQQDVRELAGLTLLDVIHDERDLFFHLIRYDVIPRSDRFIEGLEPSRIEVNEAENVAHVTTRSGQHYYLVQEEDDEWRVLDPIRHLIQQRMEQIATNKANLGATVALFGSGSNAREELIRFGLLDPDVDDEDEHADHTTGDEPAH